MTDRLDTSFLDDALKYASQEARFHVADALACHLHNDGYTLEGNTEANDVEWLARNLYEHPRTDLHGWDQAPEQAKKDYRTIARSVLAVLPAFQLRVANRLITLSKVVRDIERVERIQHKAAKRAARGAS